MSGLHFAKGIVVKAVVVLLFLFIFHPSVVFGSGLNNCYSLVEKFFINESVISSEDAIEVLGEVEELLLRSVATEFRFGDHDASYFQDLENAKYTLSELIEKALEGKKLNSNEIEILKNRISSLLPKVVEQSVVKSADDIWQEMTLNSLLVRAEVIYEVPTRNELHSLKVVFNQNVVDKLFHSSLQVEQKAAPKILTAITHGFGSSGTGHGIQRLMIDSEIIEVFIRGNDVGRVRLGGYMENGILYLVHFSNKGEHGSSRYIQTFVNQVKMEKTKRN